MLVLTLKFPWVKKLSPEEEYSLAWHKITDFEKELSAMSVQQLATALHEAIIKNDIEKRIVVEHRLNLRLAYVQSKASWGSGWLSFSGALLTTVLVFILGSLSTKELNNSHARVCNCQCAKDAQCTDAIPKLSASSEVVLPSEPIKVNSYEDNGQNKKNEHRGQDLH